MSEDKRDPAVQVSLEREDVHWDLSGRSTYGDYLQLQSLLAAESHSLNSLVVSGMSRSSIA